MNLELMKKHVDGKIGQLNGHSTGIVLKELVRRAISVIRAERFIFDAKIKMGYGGSMDDVFTSADTKAQNIYLKSIRECFPEIGVVAEENSLSIPPVEGVDAYITVDPLDGTKAFVRRQSHGVGTMIALVFEGEIVSAYIGDVNTKEIFGFRPDSDKVHRIIELDTCEELLPSSGNTPLTKQYVGLRDRESVYSDFSRRTIDACFKNVVIDGGSIGTWIARLWKREVGAVLLPPSWETPWDSAPVVGISRKLGYIFLKPSKDGKTWQEYEPLVAKEKYRREHDTLVVHQNDYKHVFF